MFYCFYLFLGPRVHSDADLIVTANILVMTRRFDGSYLSF